MSERKVSRTTIDQDAELPPSPLICKLPGVAVAPRGTVPYKHAEHHDIEVHDALP